MVSCKTKDVPLKQEIIKPPLSVQEKVIGLYTAVFENKRGGSLTYSVEFKADKTVRVLIFRNQQNVPRIITARWLITKKEVIILYFHTKVPSEFFKLTDEGDLQLLDKNKKEFTEAKTTIIKRLQP